MPKTTTTKNKMLLKSLLKFLLIKGTLPQLLKFNFFNNLFSGQAQKPICSNPTKTNIISVWFDKETQISFPALDKDVSGQA